MGCTSSCSLGWPILCPPRRIKGGAVEFAIEFAFDLAFMPKKLKRYYGLQHLHFITCTCYRRVPLFRSGRSRSVFARIHGEVRDRYGFSLVGYVVMPNHIHLLISEPAKGTPSTVMQVLKQRASRHLRAKKKRQSSPQLGLPFKEGGSSLPQFWPGAPGVNLFFMLVAHRHSITSEK